MLVQGRRAGGRRDGKLARRGCRAGAAVQGSARRSSCRNRRSGTIVQAPTRRNRRSRSLLEVAARDHRASRPGTRINCGRFRTKRPRVDGENVQKRPQELSSTRLTARFGRFCTITPRKTALSVENRPQDMRPSSRGGRDSALRAFFHIRPRRRAPLRAETPARDATDATGAPLRAIPRIQPFAMASRPAQPPADLESRCPRTPKAKRARPPSPKAIPRQR